MCHQRGWAQSKLPQLFFYMWGKLYEELQFCKCNHLHNVFLIRKTWFSVVWALSERSLEWGQGEGFFKGREEASVD